MEFDREVIKSRDGRVVGEIVRAGEAFQVWKKDPPSFPPRHRHTLIGTFSDLEDARQAAADLVDPGAAKEQP